MLSRASSSRDVPYLREEFWRVGKAEDIRSHPGLLMSITDGDALDAWYGKLPLPSRAGSNWSMPSARARAGLRMSPGLPIGAPTKASMMGGSCPRQWTEVPGTLPWPEDTILQVPPMVHHEPHRFRRHLEAAGGQDRSGPGEDGWSRFSRSICWLGAALPIFAIPAGAQRDFSDFGGRLPVRGLAKVRQVAGDNSGKHGILTSIVIR